jgi:hypothetical protein
MTSAWTRRGFLAGLGALAAAVPAGYAYAFRFEPARLQVTRHRVTLPGLAAGRPLRLLQLSDFHASDDVPYSTIETAIALGLEQQPDLICLTGDFISGHWPDFDHYSALLSQLSARAPTFAVLGNHDGGSWVSPHGGYADTTAVRTLLARSGIRLLYNERTTVDLAGRTLTLVGLGDWWADEIRPRPAFAGLDATAQPVIVMSHNPDTKDLLGDYPWRLMLSGHTHGGQIRIPGLGTPFAPVHDHRYVAGLKPWRDRWIHVTRGVGNLHGIRINCPPEVSILELV